MALTTHPSPAFDARSPRLIAPKGVRPDGHLAMAGLTWHCAPWKVISRPDRGCRCPGHATSPLRRQNQVSEGDDDMRVLIIEAGGSLGRQLAPELAERGHDVVCFDLKVVTGARIAGSSETSEPHTPSPRRPRGARRWSTSQPGTASISAAAPDATSGSSTSTAPSTPFRPH
jgi:hypothetical protein